MFSLLAVAWASRHSDTLSAWLVGGRWHHVTIQAGDDLTHIFKSRQWSPTLIRQMMRRAELKKVIHHLKPGQRLSMLVRGRQVLSMRIPIDATSTWVVFNEQGHLNVRLDHHPQHQAIQQATLTIQHTLYGAADRAHVHTSVIAQLIEALQGRIDFNHAIHRGDQIHLMYQAPEQMNQGDYQLLDAKVCRKQQCQRAIHFTDNQGISGFYDDAGISTQLAFDRTPLDHYRISSSFKKSRWHPVFHRWRSHLGVDLAAPSGTPIHATGAGQVVYSGVKGGYGKVVILKHGARYRTIYGHLSKIANISKRIGAPVQRGQVIGYVGQTGIATGPHCHYEFRINGEAVNPMTVQLPQSHRLSLKHRSQFQAWVQHLNELSVH
ncbi:MAG: hypothetical protein CMF51_02715 [Legionellales bacterium]|nr:hypothetical protein [Legionellales bacterium]|tara:strand:+ start:502 stop:1635 length:1134 start_codon:yes stop_codon:yes gene_type:complete